MLSRGFSLKLLFVVMFRIIATPGRLMHILVEMNLRLQSVEYVVFDEADRFVMSMFVQFFQLPLPRR